MKFFMRLLPRLKKQPRAAKEPNRETNKSNKLRQLDNFAKFRQDREKNLRDYQRKKWVDLLLKYKPILIVIAVVALVIGVVGGVVYLLSNVKTFQVKQIDVLGNQRIVTTDILGNLSGFMDKSLFSFSTGEVENKLLKDFPYIEAVYVRKLMPNRLEIEIEERFPTMAYINMKGVFLIDDTRKVLTVLEKTEEKGFTEDELLILNGYGDFNSPLVEAKYRSGIPQERLSTYKWEEVTEDLRRKALEDLRNEYRTRLDSRISNMKELIKKNGWDELLLITDLSDESLEVGWGFNELKYNLTLQLNQYAGNKKLKVDNLLWQASYLVKLDLNSGPDLLFTVSRDINLQIEALEALTKATDLRSARQIDLRSEVIAVR